MKTRAIKRVLAVLAISPPMTVSELATALFEKYTTVRMAIYMAEVRGLVRPVGTKRLSNRGGPNAYLWARA